MSRYLQTTRSAYYGVVVAIPLLLAYEVLLLLAGGVHGMQVRNAADVWLRLLLESLGVSAQEATVVMLLALILAVPFVRRRELRLEPRYLAAMLGEALLYSLVLGLIIQWLLTLLFSALLALPGVSAVAVAAPMGTPVLRGLALSAGAGLFEEFVFRVVLLNVLLLLTRTLLAPWLAATVSVLGAALLFSLAHYVGSLGEPFMWGSFLFRWLAGLLFTLLYYARGFGVTAYAHALYDVRLILLG